MQEKYTTKKIKVQGAKTVSVSLAKDVKISIQGVSYMEVTITEKKPRATVKKLSSSEYVVLSTGEVREYQKKDTTGKNIADLRRTFARLRGLIRANFTTGSESQLFITLTYADCMTDTVRLMKDYDAFYKKLKRYLRGHRLDYIVVAEPQERGAWHLHLMVKSDQPVLYIDCHKLEKLWGHGATSVERLKSDEIGSYYVAYFTDILDTFKSEKRRKKGARLHMYPKNFKFYRCSRGIARPVEKDVIYGDVVSSDYRRTYASAVELVDEASGEHVNFVQKETWKKDS